MTKKFLVISILIFALGLSFCLAHAETAGSIAVNLTYTNGDRADYWPISMKIYQDNSQVVYREIESITGNPFNIVSLPLGHQYKIEVYANGMHAAVRYVDLEQPQQALDVTIPLSGGMRVNVLYNDKTTPVANSTVTIRSVDNKTWATETTDARGQTLRFWLSPTTDQSDHYTVDIKIGKALSYSFSPVFLLPGISQEVNIVTPWPSVINSLITVKLYENQSAVVSPSDGTFSVKMLDSSGKMISESPVTKGQAGFYNLKVGDYVFHVTNLRDNSSWADYNATIDGSNLSFDIIRNQSVPMPTVTQTLPPKHNIINCNCVAFRLDNVQDYWLDNVQTGILDVFKQKDASITLAVIAGAFGNDSKLTGSIKNQISSDNNAVDIGINGWSFEDFTLYDKAHQSSLLKQAKDKLFSVLGVTPTVFVPPYGKIDQDTFYAMQDNGISYVTDTSSVNVPEDLSGKIRNIPVTVSTGYYHLENGTAEPMTNDMILSKIQEDMQRYGFAVVDLNFQDYALGNDTSKVNLPDSTQIEKLGALIDAIRGNGFSLVRVSEVGNQSSKAHLIPSWAKHSAQSWSQGNAPSSEFIDTVQFMIKQGMIKNTSQNATLGTIPNWVRHDAAWWSSGSISDQEFTDTIEYLIGIKAIR